MRHNFLWQNFVDYWSLAHAWGWAAGTYAACRLTRRLRLAVAIDHYGAEGERWSVVVIDRPSLILLAAVLAGVGWEVVEATWIEPWLHFREPLGNRLMDIALDATGAWVGMRTADRSVPEYREELLHPDMKLPGTGNRRRWFK